VRREAVTEVVQLEAGDMGRAAGIVTVVTDEAAQEQPPSYLIREPPGGPTRRVPLGVVAGARSGDKGGSCTLGVYTRTEAAYAWLATYLTTSRIGELLPEAAGLPITRELLPNVRAVLFQLPGLLGEGVAASTRFDPQAKSVGEWLRSRMVDVPHTLLDDPASTGPSMVR
jgi:hypothetical protein